MTGTAGLLAVSLLAACTDSFIEKAPSVASGTDDRLTLSGQVCTAPPDPSGFPVKVLFLLDQSGSMCISDPPGSQQQPGLCEQLTTLGVVPPGVTVPARIRALNALVTQFQQQIQQQGLDIEVSIQPFETNLLPAWPSTGGFAPPDPASINTYLAPLQSQLGKGTDYQGALSSAYDLIANDIQVNAQSNPAILPRTRYVVVFLTDGTPYPRCAANDNLTQYADPDHPELIWADEIPDYCNLLNVTSPSDLINGFVAGTDRNQNYQLFGFVDRMMQLKQQYNIGDIRLHTVLLLNVAAVQACGTICQDIYGVYANVAPADYPAATKKVATWLLTQMAARGNGVFQAFTDSDVQNLSLGALDYSSLAGPNVMKSLIVQSLTSVPDGDKRAIDSDGDGLPDRLDNTFTDKTNPFNPDTDGDCFDDHYEYIRSDKGFDPASKDIRGCDPNSPLTPGCFCRDTDGDGLSQFAEAHEGTNTGLVDSDGDGVPDGIEVRYRLDPLNPNAAQLDTDGDGIPDLEEIRANTDPTRPDSYLYEHEGYHYQSQATVRPDGSVCYDFSVSNIQLLTPPASAGVRQGYNLYKLWFAEAPESGVATDYGVWRTGCAWAQYDPPLRVPLGPELKLRNQDFHNPATFQTPSDYLRPGLCVGQHP